jgi:glycerol uptake facilitator-like aquaporin
MKPLVVYSDVEHQMNAPKLSARLGAEFLGTFWLVFGGCGSAVLAAKFVSDPGNFRSASASSVSRWPSASPS